MNAQDIIEYIRTSEKKTPVKVYDPDRESPILYSAGDYIRFYPISAAEYASIEASGGHTIEVREETA